MAFPKQKPRVPAAIGDVVILLTDEIAVEDKPARKTIRAHIAVLDANGETIETFRVDLEQHLAANTVAQLKTLMDTIRTKAAAEVLP